MNPRIARWALELENYSYTVRHRKGSLMPHVDALSRTHVAAIVDGNDIDVMIQVTQTRDDNIRNIRTKLETGDLEGYVIENGLVFRLAASGSKQLYVPAELEENIMRSIHEKYGHVGIGNSMHRNQRCYWFPDMKGKVSRFIRSCLKCIYNWVPQRRNERNLYNIEKKPVPFWPLTIDKV